MRPFVLTALAASASAFCSHVRVVRSPSSPARTSTAIQSEPFGRNDISRRDSTGTAARASRIWSNSAAPQAWSNPAARQSMPPYPGPSTPQQQRRGPAAYSAALLDSTEVAAEAAAAAAVAVLWSGEEDINDRTVQRTIAAFSAKIREQLQYTMRSDRSRSPSRMGAPQYDTPGYRSRGDDGRVPYEPPRMPYPGSAPGPPRGEQMMVTATGPAGTQMTFQTPTGVQMSVVVPAGVFQGQQFPVMVQQEEPGMMESQYNQGGGYGLDQETVRRVFTEFINSEYCRRLCDECNVQPIIGSPHIVGIMFEKVQLVDDKITIKLNKVFEMKHEKLLEQLVRHLKVRMPALRLLQYEQRSPPSTRTYAL